MGLCQNCQPARPWWIRVVLRHALSMSTPIAGSKAQDKSAEGPLVVETAAKHPGDEV